MLKRINYLILTGILILPVACEVPYDLPMAKIKNDYVVDGLITDNPGPCNVKLSYSAAYTAENAGLNLPIEGATVTITDDEGQTEVLSYTSRGVYTTSSFFIGIPNRTYILHIITANGDELLSNPELMSPSSPIVGDSYEFVPGNAFHSDGHQVKIQVADNPNQKNYYRWTFQGVYIFTTEFDRFPGATVCWRYEYFPFSLILASDKYFDGNTFEQDITIIPYFSGSGYLLTIFQQSLTKEAYEFQKLINDQINHSSGIFAVPPARIKGNLYCVNDPEKIVLGYFGASSILKHPIFIKRADGIVRNMRSYPRNVYCNTLPNSVLYIGDPSTWPDGWPR